VRRIRKGKENNDKSFLLSVPSSQFSFCGKAIAEEIYESTMDPIVVVIVVLSLALIAFVSYFLYKRVRVLRSGPPRSRAIQRNQVLSDKLKPENKETKVIGMINCEYCGSLIPQTDMTCPNCGASRRK
jgi:hypothetical protein